MLFGVPVADLTAPTLLGVAILLILFGRLVPKPYLVDKQKECDKWREAYELERVARAISNEQTEKLLEVALATRDIVVETFGSGGPLRNGGEADVVQDP